IAPKELDIYIPEFNLAIEYNGIYWPSFPIKNKSYHLDKAKACEAKGIRLIQIWEHEWLTKQNIIKDIILHTMNKTARNVYARKTLIKEIDGNTYRSFIETNSIYGYRGAKYKFGMFLNMELVMVWGVSKSIVKDSSDLE